MYVFRNEFMIRTSIISYIERTNSLSVSIHAVPVPLHLGVELRDIFHVYTDMLIGVIVI